MSQTTTYLGDGFTRHADGVIRFDEAPENVRRVEREGHKKRGAAIVAGLMLVLLALAGSGFANAKNSLQPARVYFGQVTSGQHPNRIVTLHNGTGAAQTIKRIGIAGSGGYVFTIAANTALLAAQPYPRCTVGLDLAPGARCAIDVRVHTVRAGWFRSVLSVVYVTGWFNSSELRAHVVGGAGA